VRNAQDRRSTLTLELRLVRLIPLTIALLLLFTGLP